MYNYKNITKRATLALCLCSALSSTVQASTTNNSSMLAIGAKIGTQGMGIEGRSLVGDQVYGRLGVNYLHYSLRDSEKELNYKGKLTLLTVPLMLDFHPVENSGFRVSLGVAYNNNQVKAHATPKQNITLHGNTYTPEEVGTVTSKIVIGNKAAPVLTIGYDNSFIDDSPFSFNAEFGAMYVGNAKVKVSATGNAADSKQQIADLNSHAKSYLKKINKYSSFYPIVSIGFKYNF